ncbi:hypothetical protein [Propionivibrio limicola]|uniref:hypothetical protein n=1 Tax=Propionivibrio limicola TaxID=167645 RepID=UPI00129275B5|nr:hypothetical protein [Propionivibrio limicola]
MLQRYQVLGCKGFKGEVEGTNYDSTTLYVVMPVSKKAGTEAGFNVTPMKYGKEEEFQKIKGLPFPIMAELEIELTTKGAECVDFKPVARTEPQK